MIRTSIACLALCAACSCRPMYGAVTQAVNESDGGPCIMHEKAIMLGDAAAVLWAKRLTDWGIPYSDTVGGIGTVEVCIVEKPAMCGSILASGCAGGGKIWARVPQPGEAGAHGTPWMAWIFAHEMAHVVSDGLKLRGYNVDSTSAHTEPIHTVMEPLVAAEMSKLIWD